VAPKNEMKSCPTCRRIYTDETLIYCLNDGSTLSTRYTPTATQPSSPLRTTSPPPTEFLPPYQSQLPLKANNRWLLYAAITLLCVVIGGGVIIWLQSKETNPRLKEFAASPAPQSSSNPNQHGESSDNDNHQNATTEKPANSNIGIEDNGHPASSEDKSPSWKLVGVWRAKVSELGEDADVTFTANNDGTYQYAASNAQGQTIKEYGMWQYSEGILYQRFSNGASGKGSIEWIDNDTFEWRCCINSYGDASAGNLDV